MGYGKGKTEVEHKRNQVSETVSLGHVVDPVSIAVFFDEFFESKPLIVSRNCPDYFRGLLNLDDIDRIITTLDIHYPDISLVKAERKIEVEEYIRQGDSIDVAQLYRLHTDGATIILNHLHTLHPSLTDLCAALELEFSCPFQSNVYVTPPHAKGFKAHFDTHDVFVLQLHGSKQWRLYGAPIPLPLAGQGDEASQDNPGTPTRELDLNAGDTLYIPRGLVHDAVSHDETSVHVTVGALSYTWTDLLFEALATAALKDPAFRRSLPRGFAHAGYDYEPARKIFRSLIERVSVSADLDTALNAFAEEFIDRRRPRLRGQMTQLGVLENLNLRSLVAHRLHLAYSIREDESAIYIRCYGKEISIPRSASAAVRYTLATPRFEVRDLPKELDDASKLVLVRRLVREGILTVVDTGSHFPDPNLSP